MDPVRLVRSQPDRALAALAGVVGLILLVVGWFGVSDQGIVAGQIPYLISCGLGGVFALATASTLWLSADLRDEWRKMDAVEAAVLAQNELLRSLRAGDPAGDPADGPARDGAGQVPAPIAPAASTDGRAAHRVRAASEREHA